MEISKSTVNMKCDTYGCKNTADFVFGNPKFPHTCVGVCKECAEKLLESLKELYGEGKPVNVVDNSKVEPIKTSTVNTKLLNDIIEGLNDRLTVTVDSLDDIAIKYGIKFDEEMNKNEKFELLVKCANGIVEKPKLVPDKEPVTKPEGDIKPDGDNKEPVKPEGEPKLDKDEEPDKEPKDEPNKDKELDGDKEPNDSNKESEGVKVENE